MTRFLSDRPVRRASKRSRGLLLLVALVLMLSQGVSVAQVGGGDVAEPSKKVTKLVIEGCSKERQRLIRSQIVTAVGADFSRDTINKDIALIFKLGYFSDVRVERDEFEDGWLIQFFVTEKSLIISVRFRGVKRIKASSLRAIMQSRQDSPFSEYSAGRDVDVIKKKYIESGFHAVAVSYEVERKDDGVEIVFVVKEGRKIRIRKIYFKGNNAFGKRKLRKRMETKPKSWYPFGAKGNFDQSVLDRDLENLNEFYASKGWLDVDLSPTIEYNKKGTKMYITINVQEGSRYVFGQISIAGNKVYSGKELSKNFVGKTGSFYSKEELDADLERVREMYANAGYLEARIVIQPSFDSEQARADIVFQVIENAQIFAEKITIQGNTVTRGKVIRRELSFFPGEPLRRNEIRDSIRRLTVKRYFAKPPDFRMEAGSRPNTRNIVIDVEEGPTGSLSFGGGASSNAGIFGRLMFTQRNFDVLGFSNGFRGAGQTFTMKYQPGTETEAYSIGFEEPYLFDMPVSLRVDGFITGRDWGKYTERRKGASVTLARTFKRVLTIGTTMRNREISIDEVADDAPLAAIDVEGENEVRSAKLWINFDNRDDNVVPSKGSKLRLSTEMAGGALGGNVDFMRYQIESSAHKTLWKTRRGRKHILSVGGSVGIIEEFGDSDDVPIFERYFAGGRRSVRGFEYRGLGPQELGEATGGEIRIINNVEYGFPLIGDNIRGIAFFDAGGISGDSSEFDFDDLRMSVGVGLQIWLPALGPYPLSFDFGFPINPERDDDLETFSFDIGTVF